MPKEAHKSQIVMIKQLAMLLNKYNIVFYLKSTILK